jgi:MFS family permease
VGRSLRPQAVADRVIFIASIYPGYVVLTASWATVSAIVATNMAQNFFFGACIGATYAYLPEAFPRAVRSSGLALLYALGVAIFGGTTQFVVAALIAWTHDPMMPAWYQLVANLASLAAVILLVPHAEVLAERDAAIPVRAEALPSPVR